MTDRAEITAFIFRLRNMGVAVKVKLSGDQNEHIDAIAVQGLPKVGWGFMPPRSRLGRR